MKGKRSRDKAKTAPRAPVALARRHLVLAWMALGAAVGAGTTAAFLLWRDAPAADAGPERHEGQQGLINPLLECGAGRNLGSAHRMEAAVRALVDHRVREGIGHVSVYFRDLNNGPWFGVNEKELFQPSSLNKVQIMLEYLKAAEGDPGILRRSLKFASAGFDAQAVVPNIRASQQLRDGETYTVEELLRRMIVYSDNAAAQLLVEADIGGKHFNFCPDDAAYPCEGGLARTVRVATYAGVFRILFNASFVNRQLSQHALEILSEAEYRDGLVAGVPAGITVAHKFGEGDIGGVKQLHDCGIVYFPRQPYLLCVMTRGRDFGQLAEVVREISRLIYGEVEKRSAVRR